MQKIEGKKSSHQNVNRTKVQIEKKQNVLKANTKIEINKTEKVKKHLYSPVQIPHRTYRIAKGTKYALQGKKSAQPEKLPIYHIENDGQDG